MLLPMGPTCTTPSALLAHPSLVAGIGMFVDVVVVGPPSQSGDGLRRY